LKAYVFVPEFGRRSMVSLRKSPTVIVVSAGKCLAAFSSGAIRNYSRMGIFSGIFSTILWKMWLANSQTDNHGSGQSPGSRRTLDTDPGIKLANHIHVASKAPWNEIKDGVAQSA
jgi:hypothetical protein